MIQLTQLDQQHVFPPLNSALSEPNGLLAFGGDLSVERLVTAYSSGIFPWFNSGEPILWWSPDPRAILVCDELHCSRSLAKLIRQQKYRVTINNAFADVIKHCASVPRRHQFNSAALSSQTWITEHMINAYVRLHEAGYAHSIEVWNDERLVGGLYGVSIGANFAGESMFHLETNTSKLALVALVKHLQRFNIGFIDCQIDNPHLSSLGCRTVSRDDFLTLLEGSRKQLIDDDIWQPQLINC